MRILIIGAGAIGSYVGASLALNHHEVVFLDRPAVAENLRSQGLRLILSGSKNNPEQQKVFLLEPPSFETAASAQEALALKPYTLGIIAVKSFDTAAVMSSLEPDRAELPPFLCLQNGVDNEPALRSVLGEGRVIAGSVTSAVGRGSSGEVILERLRGIGIAGDHPLSGQIVSAFQLAGLNGRLLSNPLAMKWSKMLTNLIANASAAILSMTPAEIFAHPGLYKLEIRQLRECLSVMAARNLPVFDLPGTPVRALAFAVRRLPEKLSRPILQKAVGSGRGGKMPSLYLDLHSGRKQSEVDYLNGAVVRYGEKAGLRAPVNRFLRDTLLAMVEGKIDPSQYTRLPEKLLNEFNSQVGAKNS